MKSSCCHCAKRSPSKPIGSPPNSAGQRVEVLWSVILPPNFVHRPSSWGLLRQPLQILSAR